jgi:hypothetical protein
VGERDLRFKSEKPYLWVFSYIWCTAISGISRPLVFILLRGLAHRIKSYLLREEREGQGPKVFKDFCRWTMGKKTLFSLKCFLFRFKSYLCNSVDLIKKS